MEGWESIPLLGWLWDVYAYGAAEGLCSSNWCLQKILCFPYTRILSRCVHSAISHNMRLNVGIFMYGYGL